MLPCFPTHRLVPRTSQELPGQWFGSPLGPWKSHCGAETAISRLWSATGSELVVPLFDTSRKCLGASYWWWYWDIFLVRSGNPELRCHQVHQQTGRQELTLRGKLLVPKMTGTKFSQEDIDYVTEAGVTNEEPIEHYLNINIKVLDSIGFKFMQVDDIENFPPIGFPDQNQTALHRGLQVAHHIGMMLEGPDAGLRRAAWLMLTFAMVFHRRDDRILRYFKVQKTILWK